MILGSTKRPVEATRASGYTCRMNNPVNDLISNIQSVVSVSAEKTQLIIASLLAGGHVMLADTHGVGKTSLARALAQSIEWSSSSRELDGSRIAAFQRVQCTVDLLPQDILGYTKLGASPGKLAFQPGPIFANFLLCDEINLLTPKTQGSFFQAMEEKAVSVEGTTHKLPDLFFIIATMNLRGSHLFPLPAPQLDRFMIRLSLGYPSEEDEVRIVEQHGRLGAWDSFRPVIHERDLLKLVEAVDSVWIHPELVAYLVAVVRATRNHPRVLTGASPRTGVKLIRLARALALVRGETWVSPDLLKEICLPALCHRLEMKNPDAEPEAAVLEVLASVPLDTRNAVFANGV